MKDRYFAVLCGGRPAATFRTVQGLKKGLKLFSPNCGAVVQRRHYKKTLARGGVRSEGEARNKRINFVKNKPAKKVSYLKPGEFKL